MPIPRKLDESKNLHQHQWSTPKDFVKCSRRYNVIHGTVKLGNKELFGCPKIVP
jgi:hypothetical protein